MNILIVDDDEHVVQSIRRNIDWEALGISRVFSAGSARQAKGILAVYPLELLLCDIEMPQASGLDLLEWVRGEKLAVQAIFLTSYASFDYARRALELESLEYFLKPVDYGKLTDGLRRAVEKARQASESRLHEENSRHWQRNRTNVARHFWSQLVAGKLPGEPAALQQRMAVEVLPYTVDSSFLPVLLQLLDRHRVLEEWEAGVFEAGICNMLEELFGEKELPLAAIVPTGPNGWVVILEAAGQQGDKVRAACEAFISNCNRYFQLDLSCGVGEVCAIHEVYQGLGSLEDMLNEDVSSLNQVLLLRDYRPPQQPCGIPGMQLWEQSLLQGGLAGLAEQATAYLEETGRRGQASLQTLKQFRMDITQVVYAFLKEREIQAHSLFDNEQGEHMYRYATASLEDMAAYVRFLVGAAAAHTSFVQQDRGVVGRLVEYIEQNYHREITREELARSVFLSQDYISRIFSKEMGVSISSYLIERRVKRAKELLRTTDMPINAISISIGYDNFAYFSKVFRRGVGMSPNEYRKTHRHS